MPEINKKRKNPASKNIMTAQKIGRNLQWEKLYFFTIIADFLFGYCVLYVSMGVGCGERFVHAIEHKNHLV